MTTVLAIDLGGTKTSTALVREDSTVIERAKRRSERTLEGTVAQIRAAYDHADIADGIGIVVPGIYNPHTGMAWAPNLWGWDHVPLRDALAREFDVPLIISSDRTGGVLGEAWVGSAAGLSDVVFVAVGTGIGVGILSCGRVIEGARGIGGAAGWMALTPAWDDDYALKGCWEAEAAGPAIARHAGTSTAEEAIDRARGGDTAALQAIRHASEFLGMGIANLISILDPEMVVLGGGVMHAADLLLSGVHEGVARWAQPISARQTRIEVTRLGEDAGLFGAARLALSAAGVRSPDIHVSTNVLRENR